MNITSEVKDAKLTATVTIPAADVDAVIKKAYKETAKKYRFPGFRAGKAPRPVIDSALGKEAVLAQATNELIGSNEGNVLNELDIVPVKEGDYQQIDLCADGTDYTYTVEFTLRPAPALSSYDAVEIEMPPAEVTEAEIDQQVDMLMGYHATFEDVERAVEGSDYVTVDIKNVKGAEALAGEGRMIAMGSGNLPKEFDEGLLGMNVDETKTISWTPEVEGAEEASVEVTVKGVKERKLPELTDEFAKTNFGFDASTPCATPSSSRSSPTSPPSCPSSRRTAPSPSSPSASSSTRWTRITSSPCSRSSARTSCRASPLAA